MTMSRDDLTEREVEVLVLIAQGFSRAQIARKISRSKFTVDAHRSTGRKALGLPRYCSQRDIAEALAARGLLELR